MRIASGSLSKRLYPEKPAEEELKRELVLELWLYRKMGPVTIGMMLPATESRLAGLSGRQNPSKRIDGNKGV